ncbi:MAG: hypothetical protein U0263_39735 [Polyangiaceae bacterium]
MDAVLESAEPAREPVVEATPLAKKPAGGAAYHESIAPELVDDLQLAIGQGLALTGADEGAAPRAIVEKLGAYLSRVRRGAEALPADVGAAHLALACLFGQAVCRAHGWGWAHLRRTRSPGIVVISRDRRYALGPRAFIDRALASDDAGLLVRELERLGSASELPESAPGRYLRLR